MRFDSKHDDFTLSTFYSMQLVSSLDIEVLTFNCMCYTDGLDANFTAQAPKPQVPAIAAQTMLVELKVLDAILAAALSP